MQTLTLAFRAAAILGLAALTLPAQTDAGLPHLERTGAAVRLIVDGSPFLALGGELHNSSSSSLEYMAPIWGKLVALHLNTVITPLSWELVEPSEGHFDFTLVDGLIQGARLHGLRVIFLWFGSWKNGVSTYVPIWVKADSSRFPRAHDGNGKALEILSTLSDAARDADARAYAALMRHIREVDGRDHTVLIMQVENEVGVLGDSRDRSAVANQAFNGPVPRGLMDYLTEHKNTLIPELRKIWDDAGGKTSGSWLEVFGKGPHTDEIFMGWNYARYVGAVAAAGKVEYPIPMYVNAWLEQPFSPNPGQYPSGGPQPRLIDVWRAAAPAIDFYSPDIYVPNFAEVCAGYHRGGNPLFIPEAVRDQAGADNPFYAFGQEDAIGYSPFAIDSLPDGDTPLAASYALLAQIAPLILDHQAAGTAAGVLLDKKHDQQKRHMGGYTIDLALPGRNGPSADHGAGLILQLGPDEFLVAGRSLVASFAADGGAETGLASVEEGQFVNGRWVPGRRLNGDEILSGKGVLLPAERYHMARVRLYRYR